ncbi:MAG: nitroreductase family protein, partial [Clostridia bacterium]|nr:nitroreductase family protein [Clostridia bacterium]
LALALILSISSNGLAMETVELIQTSPTTQAFTSDPISQDDLNAILTAGLSATSAINQQPWFFAVVTNQDVMSQLSGSMTMGAAPASASADSEDNAAPASGIPAAGSSAAGASAAKAALGDSPVA